MQKGWFKVKTGIDRMPRAIKNGRAVIALLCLLAFVFQTQIAQSHIHGPAHAWPASALLGERAFAPFDKPNSDAGGGDVAKCASCQVLAAIGAAVGSDESHLFEILAVQADNAWFVLPHLAEPAPARAGRNRGPPRA